MAVKVAINGLGRIGRCVARIIADRDDIELVAVNASGAENIIEYGFVVCKNSIIQKQHLPTELFQKSKDVIPDARLNRDLISEAIDERSRIESVLLKHKGGIAKAAGELGIHRTTLWRKIRRHNIEIKNN